MALGAEFCARRLPPAPQVREAARRCREEGLAFSLVTPVVREGAWDDVTGWLSELAPALEGNEWAANDWGLLRWARDAGLPLRPVAGRLLGRQRRDPRALELLRVSSPEDAAGLRGSAWDDPQTAALLAELGVGRVELDLLLQGVRIPVLPPGIQVSLCGPWIPVTVAPSCPWTLDPLSCPLACRSLPAAQQRCGEERHPLFSRGNALFVRIDEIPPGRALAAAGADRLVWSPELPG